MATTRMMALALVVFCLTYEPVIAQGSITLDHVDGAVDGDKVLANRPISIFLRAENNSGETIEGLTNGFRIYSQGGFDWIPAIYFDSGIGTVDTIYYGDWVDEENTETCWDHSCGGVSTAIFDELWVEAQSDNDSNPSTPHVYGEGIDTIGFVAIAHEGGIPPGLSKIAWSIGVFHFFIEDTGKLICLDSSSFRFSQSLQGWGWGVDGSPDVISPSWDGPHCFTITDQCCWALRGNINLDWQDTIDISDLTYLVGWMFKAGDSPPCLLEADVDGNDSHDIADVTSLVGYMFKSGAEPAGCP